MHDVLEDCSCTYDDLVGAFGFKVADAVRCLTRDTGEEYQSYLQKIHQEGLTKVKVADILSNLNAEPTDKQRKKYVKALQYLVLGIKEVL